MYPKKPCRHYKCIITGSVAMTIGALLVLNAASLTKFFLNILLTVAPGTLVYELWRTTPVPSTLTGHFFNWTNPQDVYNSSIKPRFEELGPYTFAETREKVEIVFNDNDTVTYKQKRTWNFDEDKSRDINDTITAINVIAVTIAEKIKDWFYIPQRGASMALSALRTKMHIQRTADELLFAGFEDPIISMSNKFPFLKQEGMPDLSKFGWFYGRNGSADFDGTYNMGLGKQQHPLGDFVEWNYKNRTPFSQGDCNKVTGVTGELFHRPVVEDKVVVFSTDACQPVPMEFTEEVEIFGIMGRKYTLGQAYLDNGTKLEENKCFCKKNCQPSGAVDVSSCRFGVPAFLSLPHFHLADPFYLHDVEGLKPEKDKHESYLILEPTTGIPLRAVGRMQLNLLVQPVDYVTLFNNLPRVYFPVLWFEVAADLPNFLVIPLKIFLYMPTTLMSIGFLLIFAGLAIISFTTYDILLHTNEILFHTLGLSKNQKSEEEPLRPAFAWSQPEVQ